MTGDDILLLGGGGFIGSSLAKRLQVEGRRVHVISPNLGPSSSETLIHHSGSMGDQELLEHILPICGTVVHAASATDPGNSARHPLQEALLNITPSLGLIEALGLQDRFHLIFISSGGTVYGNPKRLPATEDHTLDPLSYYAAGKIALEKFFRVAAKPPLKNVSILRPSNAYGPGQPLRPGFGVIRTMLEHLRLGTPMEIWGDGETIRDYLFIDDMVDALIRLIDLPEDTCIYNIGSGTGISLNQIVGIIEDISGHKLKINYRQKRHSDVKGIVLDSSRFSSRTHWHPKVSIEEGILATWRWLLDQRSHP